MDNKRTDPYYCTLSQPDMDLLTAIVRRFGYAAIIGAMGDILTQDPKVGMEKAPELSLTLGMAMAAAREIDRLTVANL